MRCIYQVRGRESVLAGEVVTAAGQSQTDKTLQVAGRTLPGQPVRRKPATRGLCLSARRGESTTLSPAAIVPARHTSELLGNTEFQRERQRRSMLPAGRYAHQIDRASV